MVDKVTEDSSGDCAIPKVWTFKDDDVANNFQHHVTHQLPWYNTTTEFVQSLILSYVKEGSTLLDIGASKGNITKALIPELTEMGVTTLAVEQAPQMAKQYQGHGAVFTEDATTFMSTHPTLLKKVTVITCFLSLMFIDPQERRSLIYSMKNNLQEGGALIIVDKEVNKAGYLGTSLSRARLQLKANQGVPLSEIAAKELSLAGVQRPIGPEELGKGFVEFFRMGEFVGWIYEK